MMCLQLSSPQPSQIRSGKGPVRRLLGGIKNISVQGTGRSPNPAPVSSSSNARNPIPDHVRQAGVILSLLMHCIWLLLQGPTADAALAPEQNTGQATNSGTAKVGSNHVPWNFLMLIYSFLSSGWTWSEGKTRGYPESHRRHEGFLRKCPNHCFCNQRRTICLWCGRGCLLDCWTPSSIPEGVQLHC